MVIWLEWEETDKKRVKIASHVVKLENWPNGTFTGGLRRGKQLVRVIRARLGM